MPVVEVPAAPTRQDAEVSLRRLRRVVRTFAFADAKRVRLPGQSVPVVDIEQPPGVDESAALVALLTAVCRPSLRLAPGVLIHAPAFSGAGTGKGLLVRVICAIAFGMHPRAMTAGGTLEELDKRLVAALIGAEQTLFLDNVNGMALRSDALASAITERPAYVRVLGSSTTRALNPVTFVVITGNGVVLSEDLARRFIAIELDAGMEDPEARDFKGDLLRDVMEHRGVLLRDALTIWRWGRLARKPGRPMREPGSPPRPREGTKLMAVLAMLRRPEGATVAQVGEATGWGKDTVRGFFAGLKKKGITVEVAERIRHVGPNRAGSRGSYTVYRVAGA